MKFEELKNSFKNEFHPVYYLIGVDEFLLSSAYNLIVKYSGLQFEDLNLIKFNEGVIDCNDVVRALETMPVFSDKKIVYLDLRMSKKLEIKNIKAINDYLISPNPTSILIINVGDNEESIDIEKSNVTVVDCNRLDYKIVSLKIKSIFSNKGKKIDDYCVKLLADYCLGDLSKIIIECDKLICYVGDRVDIKIEDIKEIVNQSIEYKVYELTEALAKKNSEKVFAILEDMKSKKDEYKTLPALIYAHFRRLFMIALNNDINNYELSKMLGVKEYAVKMSMEQTKLFSKSALKKINELCTTLDFDIKQSNTSIENAINLIVLQILNIK